MATTVYHHQAHKDHKENIYNDIKYLVFFVIFVVFAKVLHSSAILASRSSPSRILSCLATVCKIAKTEDGVEY